MGAYTLLARRLDPARAEKLILSGKIYSAEELFDMGVVDVLANDGEGEQAVVRLHQKTEPGESGLSGGTPYPPTLSTGRLPGAPGYHRTMGRCGFAVTGERSSYHGTIGAFAESGWRSRHWAERRAQDSPLRVKL